MPTYHLLPMVDPRHKESFETVVKENSENISDNKLRAIRDNALTMKAKLVNDLTPKNKLNKKNNKQSSNSIYYLFDDSSNGLPKLMEQLKTGDKLVIHGEGEPFVLGLTVPSCFDTHGRSLAELLKQAGLPDLDISIQLLACNSAVDFPMYSDTQEQIVNINFARDMARALHFEFNKTQVKVIGYTGYVSEKEKKGGFGVSSELGSNESVPLTRAMQVYKAGECRHADRALVDLTQIPFSSPDYTAPKQNALAGLARTAHIEEIQSTAEANNSRPHISLKNARDTFFSQQPEQTQEQKKEQPSGKADPSSTASFK